MKKVFGAIFLLLLVTPLFAGEWWQSAVFYEIFVRSFYDSDGDGVGDLPGLTEKLNYLNDGDDTTDIDLQIDGIWLMPIFQSETYHGYDTDDYYAIDDEYGTMEDFETFLSEAHSRGIKVILDLVINHTSDTHPWFLSSVNGEEPYNNYYSWLDELPTGEGWGVPWGGGTASSVWHKNYQNKRYYYGAFWKGMPDLNYQSEDVRSEIKAIAKFWLEKGVDGFRLDAARYISELSGGDGQMDAPETLAWWVEFNEYVKSVNPEAVLVGEAWTENENVSMYYQDGSGLDLCFDFDFSTQVQSASKSGKWEYFQDVWEEKLELSAPFNFYAPFLANHDNTRSMTTLFTFSRAKCAAVLLMTMPGTPFMYYGEEIGIRSGSMGGDEAKRTPMQWSAGDGVGFTTNTPWEEPADQNAPYTVDFGQNYPDSLLNTYKKLIRIRHDYPVFVDGSLEFIDMESTRAGCFIREADGVKALVIVNAKDSELTESLPYLEGKTFTDLYNGGSISFENGLLNMQGREFYILIEE